MSAHAQRLVIFDAFNTLVTAREDSKATFLAGLAQVGLEATWQALAPLQAASEGLEHVSWSASRESYVGWAEETLRLARHDGLSAQPDLIARIVPALEQLHQAPMMAMPDATECLAALRAAGFAIAVCSNWGWDLQADLDATGLTAYIDVLTSSAHAGYRKPHSGIYRATLDAAGFRADQTVVVGDSLVCDFYGPRQAGMRAVLLASPPVDKIDAMEQASSLEAVARLLISELGVREQLAPTATEYVRAAGRPY